MFGCRAPAPCDNWLGLLKYNDDKLVTKVNWINKQLEQLIDANKHAQKNIKPSNSKECKIVRGKEVI